MIGRVRGTEYQGLETHLLTLEGIIDGEQAKKGFEGVRHMNFDQAM